MQRQYDITGLTRKVETLLKQASEFNFSSQSFPDAKQLRDDINHAIHQLRLAVYMHPELREEITPLHTKLIKTELMLGHHLVSLQLGMHTPTSSSLSTSTPDSSNIFEDTAQSGDDGLLNECKFTITDNTKNKSFTQETTLSQLYDDMMKSDSHFTYSALPTSYLGFSEEHGEREQQEDRLAFGSISQFAKLTENERTDAIKNTIAMLVENTGMARQGSTLCLTVVCGEKLYTAHLGDSYSFLANVDASGKCSQFSRLNRMLHIPQVPAEKIRLEKEDKLQYLTKDNRIYNPETGVSLSMTRAVGDNDMEEYGLSHVPSSYVDAYAIPDNGNAWLIITCDGVIESLQEKKNKRDVIPSVQGLVEANTTLNPEELAHQIVNTALKEGSMDNISAMVIDLGQLKKTNPDAVIYGVVFDGHGGYECSDALRKQFHSTFTTQVQLIVAKRETSDDQTSESSTSRPHF